MVPTFLGAAKIRIFLFCQKKSLKKLKFTDLPLYQVVRLVFKRIFVTLTQVIC